MAEDWSIEPYEPGHEAAVLDLWRRTLGDRFPMRRRLWRQQTVGDPAFRTAAAAVAWAGSEAVGLRAGQTQQPCVCHQPALRRHRRGQHPPGPARLAPARHRLLPAAPGRGSPAVRGRGGGPPRRRAGAYLSGRAHRCARGETVLEPRGYDFAYEVSDLLLDLGAYERPPAADSLAAVSGLDMGPLPARRGGGADGPFCRPPFRAAGVTGRRSGCARATAATSF